MFRYFTSDYQFTSWKFYTLVNSNDDNNSSKELKCFPTTMTLLANPPKFTSLSSARQIYHWPANNSVNFEFACFPYPPFDKSFTVWKVSFTGDKQFTNEQISNFKFTSQIQISCVKYIPLLCRIWPGFKQKKFLVFANKVLEWYKHVHANFP